MIVRLAPSASPIPGVVNQRRQRFSTYRSPTPHRFQASPLQLQVHSVFCAIMSAWSDYVAQHPSWAAAAAAAPFPCDRTGEDIEINATALWLRQNLPRVQAASEVWPYEPPNNSSPSIGTTAFALDASTGLTVTIDPAADWRAFNIGVLCIHLGRRGPFGRLGNFRFAGAVFDNDPPPTKVFTPASLPWPLAAGASYALHVHASDWRGRVSASTVIKLRCT